MLSSTGGEKTHHSKTNKCLSPTLFSSLRPTPQRTMEEVWKDINLCSLPETGPAIRLYNTSNGNPNHPSSSSDFRNMILQDFLARPFANNNNNNKPPPPPPTTTVDVSTATTNETTLYTALPPPATALSLNSGPDHFHFLDNSGHPALATSDSCNLHANSNNSNVSSFSCPFEALAASSPSFGKKRFPELESGSGDRRHKRMIKNRESAARSRARKQECICPKLLIPMSWSLKLHIYWKRMQDSKDSKNSRQYCQAATAQLPKKKTLQRTSTAPF
ncbi:protein FD isoform X2 [Ziziphus jujuba]|uniref:Protein FD isoform X2 n=1 Tax=Ziziphus jujuba TaxID=326968 RepID=A0ABM3IU17_ZIZJJ|nr:protein FD isoform X2 [Ziziphus jujuba]